MTGSTWKPDRIRRRSTSRDRRGFVLIIVMVIVVMISLVGFSFVASTATENRAAHLYGEEIQIDYVVASAEEFLKIHLDRAAEIRQLSGGVFDNETLYRGIAVAQDKALLRHSRFSIVSPRIEADRITGIRFGIQNESNCLNLRTLLIWDRERPGTAHDALLNLPNMTESLADAILDWIDPDSVPRQFGAENDYYSSLDAPYVPRNRVPNSLEDLLLVRNVSRGLLFGADADFNYRVDTLERNSLELARDSQTDGVATETDLPWAAFLTLHSAERNVDRKGKPRINLNSADLPTLYQQLNEVFTDEWARYIVAYRQYGSDSGSGSARSSASFTVDLSQPAKFPLSSVLDLIDSNVRLSAAPSGPSRILSSPFSSRADAMQDFLPKLLDQTTTVASTVIHGRVNLNHAPRRVLMSVPGLNDEAIDRIIAKRSLAASDADSTQNTLAWLVTQDIVDVKTLKSLLPYVTVGGDVYRAQIVGFFDETGLSKRIEVVIDAARRPVRRVYWKDLSLFGPGFDKTTLGAASDEQELEPGLSNSGAVSDFGIPVRSKIFSTQSRKVR